MAIEIERKYLVDQKRFSELILASETDLISEKLDIAQGYIFSEPDKILRIRTSNNKAYLTIKGSISTTTRLEYEYEIPFSDANEMLASLCDKKIIKTRYVIPHEGHLWEVDFFHGKNEGLVIAEIELKSENTSYLCPEWVTEEVTKDPKYLNALLIEKPFTEW